MSILCFLLTLYLFILLASVILSWIVLFRPLPYDGPVRRVIDVVFAWCRGCSLPSGSEVPGLTCRP
jgi:hypothetical protein